jgi:hypothetical protein
VNGVYRARFGMGSAEAAREGCRLLKAKGDDCFVLSRTQPGSNELELADVG